MMIDHYDSFGYNLVRYFEELGQEMKVLEFDKISVDEVRRMAPAGIVLSPGPGNPKAYKATMEIVRQFAGSIPILGICLGHQIIGEVFGYEICEANQPMHGKISQVYHDGNGLFKGIPSPFRATRYHSLALEAGSVHENQTGSLNITCLSEDDVVMAVAHKDFSIFGVQFHPEAVLTEHGHDLLRNFINHCKY